MTCVISCCCRRCFSPRLYLWLTGWFSEREEKSNNVRRQRQQQRRDVRLIASLILHKLFTIIIIDGDVCVCVCVCFCLSVWQLASLAGWVVGSLPTIMEQYVLVLLWIYDHDARPISYANVHNNSNHDNLVAATVDIDSLLTKLCAPYFALYMATMSFVLDVGRYASATFASYLTILQCKQWFRRPHLGMVY